MKAGITERVPLACSALVLTACSSITGLDGGSSYSCKAPEGVTCDSVSGVYANAVANNLPGTRRGSQSLPTGPVDAARSLGPRRAITVSAPPTPAALRSSPRILRLWFKPWEDADHDLYDQGYVYVQIDPGRWQIDHVERQIRDSYLPLKAPPGRAGATGGEPGAAHRAPPAVPGKPGASSTPAPQSGAASDD